MNHVDVLLHVATSITFKRLSFCDDIESISVIKTMLRIFLFVSFCAI